MDLSLTKRVLKEKNAQIERNPKLKKMKQTEVKIREEEAVRDTSRDKKEEQRSLRILINETNQTLPI